MNEHDKQNLEFLLHASPEVLKDWESKMERDDLEYAQELLNLYALELREKSAELLVEAKLERLNGYPEAKSILDRIAKL